MHPALEIQELLSNIFQYCDWRRDLASLAKTCRAFNEPAMALLWNILDDLTVLARCVPEASTVHEPEEVDEGSYDNHHYSFHRSLTPIEWNLLYNCTRHIRKIDSCDGLDEESLKMLLKPPMTGTLFPNVRSLSLYPEDGQTGTSWLLFSFPSLCDLSVCSETSVHSHSFANRVESLPKTSPSLERLSISLDRHAGLHIVDPSFLCERQNLQIVKFPEVRLGATSLAHLSRMPALVELNFTLLESSPDQISLSDPPFFFSSLRELQISSESLSSLSQLLFRTRLPAITKFAVEIKHRPSKRDFTAFLSRVQISGMGHSIKDLRLAQEWDYGGKESLPPANRPVLRMEDLEPCMAFSQLCSIHIDSEFQVDLRGRDVVRLTSAWPQVEDIEINPNWGWNSRGGITPDELLQLLHARRTLSSIALAIDTRGYTEIPPLPPNLGRRSRMFFKVNVVDSFIEAESVTALAAFFVGRTYTLVHSWRWGSLGGDVALNLWNKVLEKVRHPTPYSFSASEARTE